MLKLKLLLIGFVCFSLSLNGMELRTNQFDQKEFEEAYSELVNDDNPKTKALYQQAAEYVLSNGEKSFDHNAFEKFIQEMPANQLDEKLEKKEMQNEQSFIIPTLENVHIVEISHEDRMAIFCSFLSDMLGLGGLDEEQDDLVSWYDSD